MCVFVEYFIEVLENEGLVKELFESFEVSKQLELVGVGMFHEGEMGVELVKLVFELVFELELPQRNV